MIDFDMPLQLCPICGETADAAIAVEDQDPPRPGDGAVCIGCLHLLIFKEDLTLRSATAEEVAQSKAVQPDDWKIIEAQRKNWKETKRRVGIQEPARQ